MHKFLYTLLNRRVVALWSLNVLGFGIKKKKNKWKQLDLKEQNANFTWILKWCIFQTVWMLKQSSLAYMQAFGYCFPFRDTQGKDSLWLCSPGGEIFHFLGLVKCPREKNNTKEPPVLCLEFHSAYIVPCFSVLYCRK